MNHFESETIFEQGETPQGKWQSKRYHQQTNQGRKESFAYAETSGSGNSSNSQMQTETTAQSHIVFQVSPDGTVILIQSTTAHSYSSSRSVC